MLPVIHLGPLALQTPGLFILAGIWLGLSLAEQVMKRSGQNADKIYNLVMVTFLAAIIGARLSYAAQSLPAFLRDPLALVSLSTQMLDPFAGVRSRFVSLLDLFAKKAPSLLADFG